MGAGNITFVLAARTASAWLALGLSREGSGMKGMDVALLRREKVGRRTILFTKTSYGPSDWSDLKYPYFS